MQQPYIHFISVIFCGLTSSNCVPLHVAVYTSRARACRSGITSSDCAKPYVTTLIFEPLADIFATRQCVSSILHPTGCPKVPTTGPISRQFESTKTRIFARVPAPVTHLDRSSERTNVLNLQQATADLNRRDCSRNSASYLNFGVDQDSST